MIKAGIIGSTGYAGAELVRLLLGLETPEKGAMARLLDLAQRGWRRSDDLKEAIDRIVSGIIGSEAAEPEA